MKILPKAQILTLNEVISQSPRALAAATEAFSGRQSLGAIGIRVPDFDKKRKDVLDNGAWLALDPRAEEARDSCRSSARVAPGWSGCPGTESNPIQSGFYANLKEEMGIGSDDIFGSNIWPTTGSIDDKFIKKSVCETGKIMYDVVLSVLELATKSARNYASLNDIDEHVIPDLRGLAESSTFLPSRLVYYDASYSREDHILKTRNYWLPWHVDFNMATAFIPALWLNEKESLSGGFRRNDFPKDNPEKLSGLLLRNAMGDVIPAAIPNDVILVQLGAFTQIVTGGILRAGPHAVEKASDIHKNVDMGRLSFGLFVYAPWDAVMKPSQGLQCRDEDVLSDDFGGLMKKAYTGDTVLDGFQRFAQFMNTSP